MRIPLTKPVTLGDEIIDHIEIPDLTGEHLWELEVSEAGMSVGQMLTVAAKASGHPPALMKRLAAADAMKVFAAVADFLGEEESSQAKSES